MQNDAISRTGDARRIGAGVRFTLLGFTLGAIALGCGASDRSAIVSQNSGDGGASSAAAPAFADENGDGGQAGISSVCNPNPANYDIPGNNCDDDGDGQVDNADPCDKSLPIDGDAAAFVKALGLCKSAANGSWGIVSATYTQGWNTTAQPADGQHGILKKFGAKVKPREGESLGVLSSGFAREFDDDTGSSGRFQGGNPMTEQGSVPPGYPKPASGCDIASDVYDVAALHLEIKVPANAQGLAFDFDFFSGEWPEFVCTTYNDGFAAFLRSKGFNGGSLDNVSFDANHNPVSVNNGFFDRCTPNTTTGCVGGHEKTASCPGGDSELDGTGFGVKDAYCGSKQSSGGGATGWLTSQAPVEPGETIKLDFMIWDTGDSAYDSSVLLDHFVWQPGPTETKTDRPK